MKAAALLILADNVVAKRRLRRLDTPQKVANHQQYLLGRQLDRLSATIPFYRPYRGQPLTRWPIVDKTVMNARFADMNVAGVTEAEARAAAEAALRGDLGKARVRGMIAGMSTGTSGNRGVYVVSNRERYRWLGAILAKTIPDFPWRPHRVAVLMPGGAQLYGAAGESRRLRFAFFDVRDGVTPHQAPLEAFDPDVVVAPPKALRIMAEEGFRIAPKHLFSGGEVLEPLDEAPVKARFGVSPRSIYQATEGFLGVACEHGTIHLNEDTMLFESEPVAGADGAFNPIITDLVRTSQAMVRYRLNDVLVPAASCACGSPLQPIARIEGRLDDVLLFVAPDGRKVHILPSTLRDALLDAAPSVTDFRAVQTGPAHLAMTLPAATDAATADAVRHAVRRAMTRSGAGPLEITVGFGIETPFDRKLRRVERRWTGPA